MGGYPNAAAFVLNPATDFLASNALADALFSPFASVDNMARMTFLDPAARSFFTHWGRAAEAVVAGLRHAMGLAPHYRRLHDLVGSLAEESEEFAHCGPRTPCTGRPGTARSFSTLTSGPSA